MKQKQRWLAEEFAKFMRVVCMIMRGKVPPIKKINIESDDVFELFPEYRESKANPNFNHITAYVEKVFNFDDIWLLYVPLLLEGRKSLTKSRFFNPNTAMPKSKSRSIL